MTANMDTRAQTGHTDTPSRRRGGLIAGDTEARPGIITTEFWLTMLFSVVVVVAGYVSDALTVQRAWTLAAVVVTGYLVSRGLAKAGSSERYIAGLPDRS